MTRCADVEPTVVTPDTVHGLVSLQRPHTTAADTCFLGSLPSCTSRGQYSAVQSLGSDTSGCSMVRYKDGSR